jgi:hypothetical protein
LMCTFQAGEGPTFGFQGYVADDISVRLMSALRSRGMTLAKIGAIFKQGRSTICRKLQGVPCLDATKWDEKQLAAWFDACALKFEQPARGKAVESPVTEDVIDLVEEDWGEQGSEQKAFLNVADSPSNTRNTRNKVVKKRR